MLPVYQEHCCSTLQHLLLMVEERTFHGLKIPLDAIKFSTDQSHIYASQPNHHPPSTPPPTPPPKAKPSYTRLSLLFSTISLPQPTHSQTQPSQHSPPSAPCHPSVVNTHPSSLPIQAAAPSPPIRFMHTVLKPTQTHKP